MSAPALSDQQAAASLALTDAFKARQNREAAKYAALIAFYYQQRVNVEDPQSVEAWLSLMIPRLIRASDGGANDAAAFFNAVRRIEAPTAEPFFAQAALGMVDPGVRKSLLAVGPYDYMNKAKVIRSLEVGPQQERALLAEAKQQTTKKVAAAVVRHAQTGSRQTIHDASQQDPVALGWVRVTKAKPCAFCAMLASRGISYRPFKEGAFDMSNSRFSGDGDAKVHDDCGCSLKPVYFKSDAAVKRNDPYVDMWSRWGAGGGPDAALRFRRGYEHWRETGDFLTDEQVQAA
jgi:hypothetical protein